VLGLHSSSNHDSDGGSSEMYILLSGYVFGGVHGLPESGLSCMAEVRPDKICPFIYR
jgi:hypothetical protein